MEPTGNRFLDAVSASEFDAFSSDLHRERIARGALLFDADDPMEFVYFPIDAVVSLTHATAEGEQVEIAMVGPEGVVGFWLAESPMMLAPWTAIAQAGGDVVRLPADRFLLLLAGIPRLRELSLAYALAQSYLMSRSVLCNRFHELTERAARWLLTFATKTTETPLPLTHEFLSQMLGAHRPSVTLALQTLSEAGLIRNEGRGRIRILDGEKLQEVACECFAKTQEFNGRVLDEAPPPHE